MSDLEPLAPADGVDLYLDARRDELTSETLKGQKYRLRTFVAWCEEHDHTNLNDLGGRDLYAFRVWRREGGYDGTEIAPVTLRGNLSTLRAFLRFCGSVDAVPSELFEQVPLPTVSAGEDVSDSTLEVGRADAILDYLERYEWASRRHVTLLLLWHTGCRAGALRALDVDDCDLEGSEPAVHFVHRPSTGTPLKNKEKSERWNGISPHVADVLRDYIDGPREDVLDKHGRAPLVTTSSGRPVTSTLRDTLYCVTRPCWRGEACPHDRDLDECDATYYASASSCPSSRSPHDVRSGRVTAYRLDDVPRPIVSDRLNASEEILDKHYDRRNERQKAEQRRHYLAGDR
ncbi:tyrosine-type recombinase/integrase [Halomarina oriensis]|uniref:Tyrosine-type recombinase/integrase n=1 Tax=Halomarina oriensis TaxID=671145 RepID=A0A6B0GJF0_9EURY|nr:tyrosine-type recombinase/integrase [Halomarina oriensis]MWG32953.1 tyrosine-type recombinase/integrase [Halomarina oriensis]